MPDSFAVRGDLTAKGDISSVSSAKDGQHLTLRSRNFIARTSSFAVTFMSAAASYEFGEDPSDRGRPKEKANKTKCGSIFRSTGGGTGSGMMEFYDWSKRAYVTVGRTKFVADGRWVEFSREATSKEGDFHNSLGQVLVRLSGTTSDRSKSKKTDIDTVQTEIVALD